MVNINKRIFKYISCLLIVFIFICLGIGPSLSLSYYQAEAGSINNNDIIKGAGVAISLLVLSQIFLNARNESDSVKDDRINSDTITEIEQDNRDNDQLNLNSRSDLKSEIKDEEVEMLARIISGEARGEPILGQIAVGAVVINRVKSNSFPDSIEGVIFQEGQFIAIEDGYYDLTPTQSSYQAALRAIEGEDPSQGAYYFFNPTTAKTLWWLNSRTKTVEIGNHVFAK